VEIDEKCTLCIDIWGVQHKPRCVLGNDNLFEPNDSSNLSGETILNNLYSNNISLIISIKDAQNDAGNIGVLITLCGLVASVLVGFLLDRTRRYK